MWPISINEHLNHVRMSEDPIKKLILRNFLSPGDIVMLTAALRDLHKCNPGKFITDVRTSASDLWLNNPYITRIDDKDPDATIIDCQYPLIHRSNQAPYHFIHGFTQFLSEKLQVSISPTTFKGDIHLSTEEKEWISQFEEITGSNSPFWIVVAGGKMDFTIKWWSHERFQDVVDHFFGKIQFVQVGEANHHHPPLRNVIDLRGKTDIRQLVRLVYHSQGVLCPVTFLMHLAAAVPVKPGHLASRACVVVAGGREPSQWEAYPAHRFLHTQGALPCCENGGCWKARTVPIGDGDEKDRRENLCVRVSPNGLPRCMDIISVDHVTTAIESYFEGGVIQFVKEKTENSVQTSLNVVNNSQLAPHLTIGESNESAVGMRLHSLRRSGTHAIANWITDHYSGKIFYVNDVGNTSEKSKTNFESGHLPAIDGRRLIPIDFDSSLESDFSLLVFEDEPLWGQWQGESKAFKGKQMILNALVLRDPYNLIASRLKLAEKRPSKFIYSRMFSADAETPEFLSLWKDYAKKFLEIMKSPRSDVILVNYNQWIKSIVYRKSISSQLNRPFRDAERERVPGDGFGSSFDERRYDQNASRMDVLNRWKCFREDERFRKWTSDDELRELSDEIFGRILNE